MRWDDDGDPIADALALMLKLMKEPQRPMRVGGGAPRVERVDGVVHLYDGDVLVAVMSEGSFGALLEISKGD